MLKYLLELGSVAFKPCRGRVVVRFFLPVLSFQFLRKEIQVPFITNDKTKTRKQDVQSWYFRQHRNLRTWRNDVHFDLPVQKMQFSAPVLTWACCRRGRSSLIRGANDDLLSAMVCVSLFTMKDISSRVLPFIWSSVLFISDTFSRASCVSRYPDTPAFASIEDCRNKNTFWCRPALREAWALRLVSFRQEDISEMLSLQDGGWCVRPSAWESLAFWPARRSQPSAPTTPGASSCKQCSYCAACWRISWTENVARKLEWDDCAQTIVLVLCGGRLIVFFPWELKSTKKQPRLLVLEEEKNPNTPKRIFTTETFTQTNLLVKQLFILTRGDHTVSDELYYIVCDTESETRTDRNRQRQSENERLEKCFHT